MRLASFNIRGAHIGGRSEFTRVVDACVGLDADILGLQEVDRHRERSGGVDQAALVARGVDGTHVYAPTRRHANHGQYGNSIVVRGQIGDAEVRILPGTGTQQPRVAVLAWVEVRGFGVSIAVTHLQHHPRRLAHLPDEAPDQLRAVLEWLSARPAPRVLLGDLNLQPPRAEPILTDAGYTIAPTGPAYPADEPRLQLDYIAVDGLVVESARAVPTGDVSDHHPIVADVRLA